MPSDLEDLIRDVLTEQAGRAPHRTAVLAGLRWGTRRPYRRLVMVAAGVAVVLAAIGIPVGLQLTSQPRPQPAVPPPASVLGTAPADVALSYRVTWVPAGFVATTRAAGAVGVPNRDMEQRWEPPGVDRDATNPAGATPYVQFDYFQLVPAVRFGSNGQSVSVHGHAGHLRLDSGQVRVAWQLSDTIGLLVTAADVPDATDVAMRMADSVVPGDVVLPEALEFGDLPAGDRPRILETTGSSPTRWTVRAVASEQDFVRVTFIAYWSTTEPAVTHRTKVTVRGRPAWYGMSADSTNSGVVVQLDPGHWLAVWQPVITPTDGSSPDIAPPDDVVSVANGMSMFPGGSFDWLGR